MPSRLIETPRGPARVHIDAALESPARGLLVLGHGAGGGPDAPDLLAALDGAVAAGWDVVRVEQPWRVAGRRVAEAPPHLDAAWCAAVRDLLGESQAGRPLVLGGRSAGARVACRTATDLRASAVLCLAFPLVPAGRTTSRQPELQLPSVPRLVIQGSRDAFGIPTAAPGIEVQLVDGADHGFGVRRKDGRPRDHVLQQVRDAVRDWIQTVT